jgi:hypothetical protein
MVFEAVRDRACIHAVLFFFLNSCLIVSIRLLMEFLDGPVENKIKFKLALVLKVFKESSQVLIVWRGIKA